MTEPSQPAPIPTLALRVEHAAASLGLCESTFRRDVLPNVRSVKVGRIRIVAITELERLPLGMEGRVTRHGTQVADHRVKGSRLVGC